MTRTAYRHEPATDFLGPGQAEQVHQTALRILDEVGLAVAHEGVREELVRRGFRVRGERVYLEPRTVEEHLEARRQRLAIPVASPNKDAVDDGRITLTVGVYAHHVHDLERDCIVPYTTDSLIEMTKLVDVLSERGVMSPAPGYPLDVAPPMQPITKYLVGALYSRHGGPPVDPISVESVPYVMDMAEVMGHPLRELPVYVFSPLRLAGESLEVVLRYRDRLEGVHVSNMASVGGTAPVLPFGALALSVAEVLGAFVVLAEITGLPVDFGLGLFAFDLRFGTMVFGSPEAYLFGQLIPEMNAYYHSGRPGRGRGQAAAGIHSRANFPGPQSSAEKAALMTAGALIGQRHFDGAGILSVDEVFSAEQLLLDCEAKDMVERLVQGLDMSERGYDWVEEVRRGVESSFIGLNSTLDHYRETYWHPLLYDRGFLAKQGYDGRLKLAHRARDMVRDYLDKHEFELDAPRRQEMQRLWRQAARQFGEGD